ncbi:MAG: hypothetical protein GY724_20970 [Actinomycetia bacterium]|nr:hypothetical protein [Actinomycetes bacterium]MCP5033058.1 hypothetical protein [Actinomycetes bacterium]
MPIHSRILRLIARGDSADEKDPDELVEFATVEPYEAPMLREVLVQNDIETHGSDSLIPGTWIDKVVLQVARRDLDAATEILRTFRAR